MPLIQGDGTRRMNGRNLLQFGKLLLLLLPVAVLLLMAWIGLVFLHARVSPAREGAAPEMLQWLLCALLVAVALPLTHRQFYREAEAKNGDALLGTLGLVARRRTIRQTLLYGLLYGLGGGALLAVYGPLSRVRVLMGVLSRHSAGNSSYAALVHLVTVLLPMALLCLVAAALTRDDAQAVRAGHLPMDEALRRQQKVDWIWSFTQAFVAVNFLCFFAGQLVATFLR